MVISEKRTMIKVPCGGFKLDNNFLGMNENDELSLTGGGEGKAYQYLVTDSEGKVKWEDRLAYDDSKLVVDAEHGMKLVKVADEVPSWASVDATMKVWVNNGTIDIVPPENYIDLGNGSFVVGEFAFFIATDNFEASFGKTTIVFQEKGAYFISMAGVYTTGIASADSDTPEITWDGNIGTLKTIDPKYIPSELNEVILPSSTSGSSKRFKITVDDSGAISATEVTS